jgi:hypothetical protein
VLGDMAVVMTAYRRPYYLAPVLESWSKVRGVRDLALFRISLDASDRTEEMLQVIEAAPFPADVRVNLPRLGVNVNKVEAATAVFREHPRVQFVVHAEDDLVVADDVLKLMDAAAAEFREDPEVAIVCSQSRVQGTDPAVVRSYDCFSSAWVWGTWRDRWFGVLEPTWDRDFVSTVPETGWDWNIDTRVFPRAGLRSVAPDMARAQNIGEHEGTYAPPGEFPSTLLASFRPHFEPVSYRFVR